MPQASFGQWSFLGGEISQAAQGRIDDPHYKISMNVCLNGIPVEPGAWVRRPGTRYVAHTRGGEPGRGISFSFVQAFPSYVMQFTQQILRFTAGAQLVTTNDAQAITAISAGNPAQITTTTAHGWPTGVIVVFRDLGVHNPLLQNRQFLWTSTGTTTGTLQDAITTANIDGATLGTFVSGTIARVMEILTPYTSGSWASIRSVQAENRTLLLNGVTHPQVLQVSNPPTASTFATFTFGAADFVDGPYLDPINGSVCAPSAQNGVISLTFGYQAYDATRAYNVGDYVTFSGQGYQSLTALNQGNAPNSSPLKWQAVNGGAAINSGRGFVASDIGRLVRLLSEPAAWNAASTYTIGTPVSYPADNGVNSYWTATTAVAANVQPGTSVGWAANATGGKWTWGQITAVTGVGLIAPQTAFGRLVDGGGIAAAFDSTLSKSYSASAAFSNNVPTRPAWFPQLWARDSIVQYQGIFWQNISGIYNNYAGGEAIGTIVFYGSNYWQRVRTLIGTPPPGFNPLSGTDDWIIVTPSDLNNINPPPGNPAWTNIAFTVSPTYDVGIGQTYATGKTIAYATLYPTSDVGFVNSPSNVVTLNLRGNSHPPGSNFSDGTLLGSAQVYNTTAPVTITSSDQTTSYTNVWFEIIVSFPQPLTDDGSHNFITKVGVAQAQFYSPNINNGSVVQVQIRGDALLYSQQINTWRLGVYSDTTGWPTCGTYHEDRIWLGGVVGNRFDASVSSGFIGLTSGQSNFFTGATLDFTPTSPYGVVSANNAISYTVAGEDVNPILWMKTDAQGVLFGTKSGEYLIFPPTAGALAPTNVKATKQTSNGCANVEPRRTEHTLVVVHKALRKVIEMFADVFSGKFTAPNLAERAKHLTVSGIAEIAYQQELAPIIWIRRNDGVLIGMTYKRDTLMTSQGPTIVGWHRHLLGSGRLVESLSSGPSESGNLDTVALVTNDAATGIRHIEMMTDLLDEGFLLQDCWFLDDAIVPTSTSIELSPTGGPYGALVVNGLWPHNGKTVQAFIAGLDCGAQYDANGLVTYVDFVVSNGSITIPFGDGVSGGAGFGLFTAALVNSFTTLPAVVGFTYNSDGQMVAAVEQKDTGARNGPGWGKLGRMHRAVFQLYGAVNGSFAFGSDFVTLDPLKLSGPDETPYTPQQLWSGVTRQEINSTNEFTDRLTWRIARPLPVFVNAAGAMDNTEDV